MSDNYAQFWIMQKLLWKIVHNYVFDNYAHIWIMENYSGKYFIDTAMHLTNVQLWIMHKLLWKVFCWYCNVFDNYAVLENQIHDV